MKTLIEFADQKFKIECINLRLIQCASDNPVEVAGPGEVWQDDKGIIQFKLFVDRDSCKRLHSHLSKRLAVGEIIPDDYFLRLEVTAVGGEIWEASGITPGIRSGLSGGVVYGHLFELNGGHQVPSGGDRSFVRLRIRGRLDFPCNIGTESVVKIDGKERNLSTKINVAHFGDESFKFELLHESEHTSISLELPRSMRSDVTVLRIQESLQFVLGRQLAVLCVESLVDDQLKIKLLSARTGKGKVSPPLEHRPNLFNDDVWKLFLQYFRYVHDDVRSEWHPISQYVEHILESTVGSLEMKVLALAVSLEGLAGECFGNLSPVDEDFLSELTAIDVAIERIKLSEQSKGRVSGALRAMRKPRNSDAIREFIRQKGLPKGLYESWSGLRNSSAHGKGVGGRQIEMTLRMWNEVLSLMYSMIFESIGYRGPRTDYSVQEWPNRIWGGPALTMCALKDPNAKGERDFISI